MTDNNILKQSYSLTERILLIWSKSCSKRSLVDGGMEEEAFDGLAAIKDISADGSIHLWDFIHFYIYEIIVTTQQWIQQQIHW